MQVTLVPKDNLFVGKADRVKRSLEIQGFEVVKFEPKTIVIELGSRAEIELSWILLAYTWKIKKD